MADASLSRPTMPSRQLAIVAGVLAATIALLGIAYYLFLRADYVVLAQQLKPAEAAALVAELDKRHASYRLRDGGTTILVPEDQADSTRLAIAGADPAAASQTGFELFNKSDMGLTDFAQKINYQRALQGELARTIMAMDGVEAARVHLALPERGLFRAERSEPRAAVSLTMKPGQTTDSARVLGIQRLVAAAVPDLTEGRVVVLDASGRVISTSPSAPTADSDRPAEFEEKAAVQQYYHARARRALESQLPGARFTLRALALPLANDAGEPAGWAPGGDGANRNFRLRLILITPSTLGADDQQRARSAIGDAVGLDPARGDTLEFAAGPLDASPQADAVSAPAAAPVVRPVTTSSTAPVETPGIGLGWFLAAAAAMIALVILAVRLLRPSAMSVAEHEDFARRLRRQLNLAGDPDASA